MAERRCFTKKITESDAFLDMPLSTQCLYFHLNMNACDDDGFVSNPKRVMKLIGASDDDLKLLIIKNFVIAFDSGVLVIKHWRMHNTLRNDRYVHTSYIEELNQLDLKENGSYTLGNQMATTWQPLGNQMATEDKISKDKISKDKISKDNLIVCESKRFTKPTIQEITDYINEKGYSVDADRFFDYYESNGWKVGRNPMKDWKACLRTWQSKENGKPKKQVYTLDEMDVQQADIEAIRKQMFKKG